MRTKKFLNAGSIHDVPIGKGSRFSICEEKFAVFRETYGHFYVLTDEYLDSIGRVSQGNMEGRTIKFTNGHTLDLVTGQLDGSDHFVRSFVTWIENGFILFHYNPATNSQEDSSPRSECLLSP